MKKFLIFVAFAALLAIFIAACAPAADQKESISVRGNQDRYVDQVPPPSLDFPWERYLVGELYKLRNGKVSTFSLTWDPYRGKISWSCPSIGYPIPGGTEMSNPDQIYSSSLAYPQAEPNGLFPPGTALGTYVICVNTDGSFSPVYIEDNVRTYPQPMTEVDGAIVPVSGSVATVKINMSNPK